MDKIKWCIESKNGIELVEPNQNLADGYIKKAEEAMETSKLAKSKEWKISAAYYTLYFSTYSLLMKLGIKCEIHSCTIEFAKSFLKEYFTTEDLNLLEVGFEARKDAQYYVNREVANEDYDLLIQKAPYFLITCKNIVLDEKKIKEIRLKIKNYAL